MRLYLVRHGQPELAPGVCYGSTDVAVSAREHARVLSAIVPLLPKHAPVYSSPLRRCSELALRLVAAIGTETVIHDERLAEMHFGAWEMREWEKIPRDEVDAWADELVTYRPGGGETVLEVARRVSSFHQDLLSSDRGEAVIVCHAGTIRLLAQCRHDAELADIARYAAQAPHKIGYGEMLVLD